MSCVLSTSGLELTERQTGCAGITIDHLDFYSEVNDSDVKLLLRKFPSLRSLRLPIFRSSGLITAGWLYGRSKHDDATT